MKTNQLTQEKEQNGRQKQKDHIDSNQHLENDEKILYSESVENTGVTLVGIATTLFITFGFPFYIIIGFTALTAYLSERTWSEFGQEIIWPAGILLSIAVLSIVLAGVFRTFYRSTMGLEGTKFLITNKRIYNYNPQAIMPVMFESCYPDVLYIYAEKIGKLEYLQVRVKAIEESEGYTRSLERLHTFAVKNAKKAFMHIPDEVRWQCREKSRCADYGRKSSARWLQALQEKAI